jgi:hypothetical protein
MAQQLASNPPDTNGIQVLKGVSQAEFIGWLSEMQALDEAVAAEVDRRKAKLAEIKQRLGKDEFASFKSVRKDAEMPGENRERRELARRKMMLWLNKPLGHQASFDMESDDANVVALNTHTLKSIDTEGYAAGKAGHHRGSNPYTPGTEAAQRFDTAWLRGQSEIAQTLAPDADQGERRRGRRPGTKNRTPEEKAADLEREARRLRGDDVEEETAPGQVH